MADTTCPIPECARPLYAWGLCGYHHRQAVKAMPCVIDGCDRGQKARGWCEPHYLRWKDHGDPLGGKPLRTLNGSALTFIARAATFDGDECLEWPYSKNDRGYGQFYRDGRSFYAHREVLTLTAGPPPFPDAEAAHAPVVCHNRLCVNPRHLRWATPSENSRDRFHDGTFNSFRKPAMTS